MARPALMPMLVVGLVLFFSLTASVLSAFTWFFGWQVLSWQALGLMALAGFFGGLGQILLTESYRHADVSTVAPFEYTSIILGSVIAYLLFGEVPTATTLPDGSICAIRSAVAINGEVCPAVPPPANTT